MDTSQLIPTQTDLLILEAYLSGRSLYAHLTTDIPALDIELTGQLNTLSGGNYGPLALAGVQVLQDGAGAKVVADPITWIGLTADQPIAAIAFCVQLGVSPSSGDLYFSSLALTDSAGLPTVRTPDGSNFPVDLTVNPLLRTRN